MTEMLWFLFGAWVGSTLVSVLALLIAKKKGWLT